MNNTLTHVTTIIETLAIELTEEKGVLGARILAPLNPELWKIYPEWRKIEIKIDRKRWPQFFVSLPNRHGEWRMDKNHREWETFIRERVERTEASLGYANPIEWEIVSEYPWVRPNHKVITELKVHPKIPNRIGLPRILRWAEMSEDEWNFLEENEQQDLLGEFGCTEMEVIRYD